MVDKQVFGDVSAPIVPCGIVMNIHPNHLLIGKTVPLLCHLAVVFSFCREHNANFFVHNNLPVIEGARKPAGNLTPLDFYPSI